MSPSAPGLAAAARPVRCTACGGSGVLRQGSDDRSTCLDCLGLGLLQPPESLTAAVFSASSSAGR